MALSPVSHRYTVVLSGRLSISIIALELRIYCCRAVYELDIYCRDQCGLRRNPSIHAKTIAIPKYVILFSGCTSQESKIYKRYSQ